MKVQLKLCAVVLLGSALSGCMSLSPVKAAEFKHYVINEMPSLPTKLPATQMSLTVMPIGAAAGFDTNAMLYLNKPYQLAAFTHNDWTAPPANMLNTLLLTSLQRTGAFYVVVGQQAVGNTDLLLSTELLALYQDFTVSPSQVVLAMQASLANSNGKVLASEQFSAEVPAHADNPQAGVIAVNQAAQEVLGNISQFVVNHAAVSS